MAGGYAERLDLMRAMMSSPFYLSPGVCDWNPPLELIGVYISHSCVSRMVMRGQLDVTAGTFLNAALGCHAFCILHHCTHESISRGNNDHVKLENTVFRLANFLIFFDDGYKEAHRAHHQRTNEPSDPDLILSETSLPVLGSLLYLITSSPSYLNIGIPLSPSFAEWSYWLGVQGTLMRSGLLNYTSVNWDNMLGKMASMEVLSVLSEHPDYATVHNTLQSTWRTSYAVTTLLLSLFFARYPHRNGRVTGAESSFYDSSFRGANQVDLWMMGEGPHHMHHARSDVSYALLPKVCADVEATRPDIKQRSRGNADTRRMESTHDLPPKLRPEDAQPNQTFTLRTMQVREAKDKLVRGDMAEALQQITSAVMTSALHCCTHCDCDLLRHMCHEMKFPSLHSDADVDRPVAHCSWHKTLFQEHNQLRLKVEGTRIVTEAIAVAKGVSERMSKAKISSEDDIKHHYLDFFVALVDTMIPTQEQQLFAQRFNTRLSRENTPESRSSRTRGEVIQSVKKYLQSPIPANFLRGKRGRFGMGGQGDRKDTQERLRQMLSASTSKL